MWYFLWTNKIFAFTLYVWIFFMLQNYQICSVCTKLLYEYGTKSSVYGMKCMWV